jgi:hypothetical protein
MKRRSHHMIGEQASELSKWCSETAERMRGYCQMSDEAARQWWDAECEKPAELNCSLCPWEYMFEFADRLQAEAHEWGCESAALYAEEDGYGDEPV